MKPIALFFISTALLASPALANDLCTLNLKKLDNSTTTLSNLGSPLKEQVAEYKKQAEEARRAGDTKACILHSTKALHLLEAPGDNGSNTQ